MNVRLPGPPSGEPCNLPSPCEILHWFGVVVSGMLVGFVALIGLFFIVAEYGGALRQSLAPPDPPPKPYNILEDQRRMSEPAYLRAAAELLRKQREDAKGPWR